MIRKKLSKTPKKKSGGQHRTTDPRELTAEGWWRRQAKQKGKVVRPRPEQQEPI